MNHFYLMCVFLLLSCGPGPGGAGKAKFTILNEGKGDAVVTNINRSIGSRFSFALLDMGKLKGLGADSAYTRNITLEQGANVVVYSTHDEDVYIESASDGDFIWGGSLGILSAPQLNVRLPLKQDLEWETADENGVPFYRFKVEAIERIDVPAGTFVTARTLQINLKGGGAPVTRWYAEDVGLVQRNESILLRYQLNSEAP
jgi:hypothetical protein